MVASSSRSCESRCDSFLSPIAGPLGFDVRAPFSTGTFQISNDLVVFYGLRVALVPRLFLLTTPRDAFRKMDHITGEKNHQRIAIPSELDLAPFVRPDKPVEAPFPMRALLPPLPSQAHPPGKRPYHTTYPSRSSCTLPFPLCGELLFPYRLFEAGSVVLPARNKSLMTSPPA